MNAKLKELSKIKWKTAKTGEEYMPPKKYAPIVRYMIKFIDKEGYYRTYKGIRYKYFNYRGRRYWIARGYRGFPILNREKN